MGQARHRKSAASASTTSRALAASGAFGEVRELPGGQVLLRATPLLEQCEGAAVQRVFHALVPVLLSGRVTQESVLVGLN